MRVAPSTARTGYAMQSAKIQTRGRLTLPAEVRQALNVEPGDQVTFKRRPVSRLEVGVPRTKRQMELPI